MSCQRQANHVYCTLSIDYANAQAASRRFNSSNRQELLATGRQRLLVTCSRLRSISMLRNWTELDVDPRAAAIHLCILWVWTFFLSFLLSGIIWTKFSLSFRISLATYLLQLLQFSVYLILIIFSIPPTSRSCRQWIDHVYSTLRIEYENV